MREGKRGIERTVDLSLRCLFTISVQTLITGENLHFGGDHFMWLVLFAKERVILFSPSQDWTSHPSQFKNVDLP